MTKASKDPLETVQTANPAHGATHRGATQFLDSGPRAGAYRSVRFVRALADVTERDHLSVRFSIEVLLDAGILPIHVPVIAAEAAAAMEGARILAAIASRQVTPGSVLRSTGRILSMKHLGVVADPKKAGTSGAGNGLTFEMGLTDVLQETWNAAVGALVIPSNIMVTWSEGGRALFGRLQNTRAGLTSVYASETVRTESDPAATLQQAKCSSVGGSGFTALSVLGFAETLRDAVSDEDEEAGS